MKRIGLGLCAIVLSSCSASSYSPKQYSDDFALESCEGPPKELYESGGSIERLKELYRESIRISSTVKLLENDFKKYGISEGEMVVYSDIANFKDKIQHRLFNVWTKEFDKIKSVPISDLSKIKKRGIHEASQEFSHLTPESLPLAINLFATNVWQYSEMLYREGGQAEWINNDRLMSYLFKKNNLFDRE